MCSTPGKESRAFYNGVVFFIFGTLVPAFCFYLWYFFPNMYFNTRYPAKRTFITPPFRFSNYGSQPVFQNTPRHFLFCPSPHPYIFFCYSRATPIHVVLMIQLEPTSEHPVPFDLSDERPKTHADSVAVAVNTVDLINTLGPSIDFNDEDLHKAADLVTGATKPNAPKTISKSAEAAAAHHLVKRFDFQAFSDALQARNFITNKLIELADNGDPKIELKALELLGKHSDIGLFTERSEITVHHTTSASLENSIKERVKRLLNTEVSDITPLDDLDAQLGMHKAQIAETPETPEEVEEVLFAGLEIEDKIPESEVQDNE